MSESNIINQEQSSIEESLLDDGKGNTHSRICPQCHNRSMYIFLPGDFRCRICYEEKWVTIDLEKFLKREL